MVEANAQRTVRAVVRLHREEGFRESLVENSAQLVSDCADIDVAAERVEARLFKLLDAE